MEVISFVGSPSSGRIYKPGKNTGSIKNLKKFKKLKAAAENIGIPRFSVPKVKVPAWLKSVKIAGIALTCAAGLMASVFVYKTVTALESYTGPVLMETTYETEEDILKAAMSKFAMNNNEASFDENGNVLSEDGSVLTASSLGIAKAISYSTYKVKSGDTISSIALKASLTNISTLIAVNGIDNVRTLRAGQKLRIPNQDGLTYSVARGDTINGLSLKFHVSMEEILDVNDLSSKSLSVGQEIFIPGAKMDAAALKKAMGDLFICPISTGYRITSRFGRRADPFTGVSSNHTGVDLAAPSGTPINAAMSGKVVYVGYSNIFGNYVIINHGNGYQTLYGHMTKALCHNGQQVSQGTRIGLVGSTGYSTGPHLHFTVYKNGSLVDPLSLLRK